MTEPFEPADLSYLEQEAVEWNERHPPFSYFVSDDWVALGGLFSYDYEEDLESSPASLALDPAAMSTRDSSHERTDVYKDCTAEGDSVTDTPSLGHHDGASDVASRIVSNTEKERPPTGQGDGLYSLTSFRKAPRVAKSSLSRSLKCKWKHCEYSGGFSQMATLLRHIKTKHISPGFFECPEGECRKSFNRKDNLVAHIRNIHHAGV